MLAFTVHVKHENRRRVSNWVSLKLPKICFPEEDSWLLFFLLWVCSGDRATFRWSVNSTSWAPVSCRTVYQPWTLGWSSTGVSTKANGKNSLLPLVFNSQLLRRGPTYKGPLGISAKSHARNGVGTAVTAHLRVEGTRGDCLIRGEDKWKERRKKSGLLGGWGWC